MTLALNEIHVGDCRRLMAEMDERSVNLVVTSPPYWGLRSYLPAGHPDKALEMGLEGSVTAYIEAMVDVFRGVHRVLRKDGLLFLNMGDSYVNEPGGSQGFGGDRFSRTFTARSDFKKGGRGLKTKDLVGVPWRLALALQEDGWWLRQDNIWHKPNPYPEAVRDRTTRAHDYVFMLSKSATTRWWRHEETREWASKKPPPDYRWLDRSRRGQRSASEPEGWLTETFEYSGRKLRRWTRVNAWQGYDYWYDADAIRERASGTAHPRGAGVNPKSLPTPLKDQLRDQLGLRPGSRMGHEPGWRQRQNASFSAAVSEVVAWRNKRSVWTIPTSPTSDQHFASFPEDLACQCILAGCPASGVVMDPFAGRCTVPRVAEDLGRDWVALELNPEYVEMGRRRMAQRGLFSRVG